MRRIVVGFIIVIVLAGVGLVAYRRLGGANPANTAVVRRGTITATVETVGKVRAAREARLSLRVGGTVKRVHVEEGDVVEAGQLLLELDTAELERQVRQAELSLELAELRLREARSGPSDADIEVARANLRRAVVAREAAQADYDAIADQEDADTSPEAVALEAARTDYQRAQAEFQRAVEGPTAEELGQLETQVEQARVLLEEARARLDQAQLRAPFAGTVTAIEVSEEENVNPTVPLMVLADLTTLQILAEVDEIDIGEVAMGQEVSIRLDAFPGQELRGRVVRVAPAASTQRGSSVYEAVVAFAPQGLDLKIGMGANLKITTLEKAGVLLVPNRAVQSIGRKKIVKVLVGGQIREVEVTTGLSNESETEIVEGLSEGQIVVIE